MKLAPVAMLPKSALPYDFGHTLNNAVRVLGSPIMPEVRQELRTIWKNVAKQLRRYGHAIRFLSKERAEHLEYRLTASFGFRVISVLHSYPKSGEQLTFEQVKKLANRVNPNVPSGEKVVVTAMPKADGGKRPIIIFGRVARANQSMARDLIVRSICRDGSDEDVTDTLQRVSAGRIAPLIRDLLERQPSLF